MTRDGVLPLIAFVLGASLIGLSLLWRYNLHLSFLAGSDLNDVPHEALVMTMGAMIALTTAFFPRLFLLVSPFAGAAMAAPQISGLPFIREFGLLFAGAGVLCAAMAAVRSGRFTQVVRAVASRSEIRLLGAFVIVGLVPIVVHYNGVASLPTRVAIAHWLVEALLFGFVGAVVALRAVGTDVNGILDGTMLAAVAVVAVGTVAVLMPFSVASPMNAHAYGGSYFFCRMQLGFYGPTYLSIFLAAMTPLLVYGAVYVRTQGLRVLFLAAASLAPLLVFAAGSRPVRLAMVVMLLAIAVHKPFRRLALAILLPTVLFYAAFYEYRCLVDVAIEHVPWLLPEPMRIPSGGTTPGTQFFADEAREQLRAEAISGIWGLFSGHLPSTLAASVGESVPLWRAVATFLFGFGPGISTYEVFGLSSHTSYIDLFTDRGLIGYLLLAAFALLIAYRLLLLVFNSMGTLQSLAVALLASFFLLAVGAVSVDIRNLFFVWVLLAFIVAMRANGAAAESLMPRRPLERQPQLAASLFVPACLSR